MVTEVVLLLAIYASLILGLFVHPQYGVVSTFNSNLPQLSARIEKHIATGDGFCKTSSAPFNWKSP